MSSLINDINTIINKVNELTENNFFDEAYKEYMATDKNIESMKDIILFKAVKYEQEQIAEFYCSYAYFLFSFQEYEEFFKMYIKAQRYGYPSEKRKAFIYGTFIEPNIDSLKSNYIANIDNMKNCGCIKITTDFDQLSYWLITTGNENEYYIYEKETDFIKEKISTNIKYDKLSDTDFHNILSDYLIVDDNNGDTVFKDMKKVISKGKKAYLVTNHIQKLLSYFQGFIIENKIIDQIRIFKNEDEFKEYFSNNNSYLPRAFIGDCERQIEYRNIIGEIHKSRITNKERECDNILLSICIPSYNRGQRAYDNVIHTLQSEFDEEIEIIISNNGTQNSSKTYYEKISEINDRRVVYFGFDENQGYAINLCKAVDLARGKYILTLSDEDTVNLEELKFLVSLLISKKDYISVIRTKTDGQGIVPFIGMKQKGKDALFAFMLTSNYMSGIIFNNKLLREHKLIKYIKDNLQNETCFHYPHMVWEIVLCQYGNVLGLDSILINEGKAEKTEAKTLSIGQLSDYTIPEYATIQGRLAQYKGFYDIIKELEISNINFDILRELHIRVCRKTNYLIRLSMQVYYKKTDIDIKELLEKAYNEMIEGLEDIYKQNKYKNKYWYTKDLEEIKSYYNY